jgi:tetratricopeptide (TPR) repeat protein
VAGLQAALVLVFLAGSSGVLWQWQRARRERDSVQQEKERAEHHLQMVCDRVDQMKLLGSNLLLRPGKYPDGHAVLKQALGFYQDMLPEDLNDPKVREKAVELFDQVAVIHRTLGEADKALEAYGEKARLLTSLVEERQGDKDLRIQLAESHRWQGNVLRGQGNLPTAREAYDKAATLHQALADDYPDVARYKVALANTLINIAALPWQSDQIEELDEFVAACWNSTGSRSTPNPTTRPLSWNWHSAWNSRDSCSGKREGLLRPWACSAKPWRSTRA